MPAGGVFPTIYGERAAAGNDIFKLEVTDAGKLQLTYRDDAGTINQIATATTVADDEWHFVALTKDGTAIKIYVDDVEVKTGTLTATDTFTNADLQSRIGGDIAGGINAAYTGYIDEVALYVNRVLVASSITYHYRATGLGATQGYR